MEQIAINILPKGAKPVCHSSQFDEGRQIMFNLFNDDTPYTLSGTETISVLVRKPDGAEVVDSVVNTSDSYVIWDVSADACELSGVCECELSIVKNGILLGSKNFTMKVEEDAYNGKTIEVRTASGRIATFSTNMVEAFKSLKSKINPVQDLHGYSKPWSGGGGKNKLNYDAWKTTGITRGTAVFENNGVTITATSSDAFTNYNLSEYPVNARVPISEGETITLSWEETTNKNGDVYIFPNGTTSGMISVNNWQAKKLSYTATSGVTYVSFRFGVTISGDTIAYKNIQIEKGNQATAYEPYSNICPISGFSASSITRTGVNLIKKQALMQPVHLASGTTIYTKLFNFSGQINLYGLKRGLPDIVANWTSLLTMGSNLRSVTLTDDYDYIGISSGAYSDLGSGDMQVSLAPFSDYTPYVGSKYQSSYFSGLANGTYGFIDLGNLTWNYNPTYKYFWTTELVLQYGAKMNAKMICPLYYVPTNAAALSNPTIDKVMATAYHTQNNALNIRNLDYTDASTFKTAMSGVYLIYELATATTPTITQSEIDTLITAFNADLVTVIFGQTVYGGQVDVAGGKVNKTHALTPLNNKSWVKSGNKFYTTGFDNAPDGALYTGDFACAIGTPVNKEWNALAVGECCLRSGLYSLNKWSFVYCTDAYATVEEFVSALNADCTITYPLATPIEITTTPENLSALSGQNNVYSDTNGDTTVEYYIEV